MITPDTVKTPAPLIPTVLEPHGQAEMEIRWNDGSSFLVPYFEIRFHCPCAGCVDEHTGQRTLERGAVRLDIRPKGVSLVGRYAIMIEWSDGHSTGMYHFDSLRKICEANGRKLA